MIRVLIWNEFWHEQKSERIRAVYPDGIHGCIRDFLKTNEELEIRTATLYDEDLGLTSEILDETDVLIWWAHVKHADVPDEVADRIVRRVNQGMGFIALHSAHHSKVFCRLMGTSAHLQWRESNDYERLWNIAPNHPVMKGIPEYFELDAEETYGERFDIPQPDELLMIGWFSGGEVFRSVCTFTRGLGRVLYIQPGHESFPTFKNPYMQKLITNGVFWAAPNCKVELSCPHAEISPEDRRKSGDQPTDYVR